MYTTSYTHVNGDMTLKTANTIKDNIYLSLYSNGLSLTYHLALSMLNVINASLPPIPVCVVFPKVLFLSPYFSLCTSPFANHQLRTVPGWTQNLPVQVRLHMTFYL